MMAAGLLLIRLDSTLQHHLPLHFIFTRFGPAADLELRSGVKSIRM
jgi:hypothetical protein